MGDFIDEKIIIPMNNFADKHYRFIFWCPIGMSIASIIITTISLIFF